MALVRVYCGLASADHTRSDAVGKALTVAVVDDSGRLLDVRAISDDPAGYAHLGVVLAERSSGPAGVAIATDSDDHYLVTLLTAAGRPLAFADDDAVDDFAERFADDESIEEIESSPAERRAIGLARALQAGVLSAVVQSVPREMAALKPVLAAHAAVAVGRQAAAVALREVLRELYPAALRAYPDPAEPVPLVVLDALPEPGLVNGAGSGRGHDSADALAHQLAGTGVADAATIAAAVTALRVAVAETPRRNGTGRAFADTVATTVREAVAAVRACDAASTTLITAVAQRTGAATVSGYGGSHAAHQRSGDGALRAAREGTAEHARIRVPLQRRGRAGATPASA
ncbi:MAG: transposase, partial [Dactylosporangium sp.]|nr:transposase [Dactylosporangium sp.]